MKHIIAAVIFLTISVVAVDRALYAMSAGGSVSEITTADAPRTEMWNVTGIGVNVRSGPSKDHSVLGQIGYGDLAEVLEDPGFGWVRVRTDLIDEAWISAAYLSPGP